MNPSTANIRQIQVNGLIAIIPLTKGFEAIIDAADVNLIAGVNWHSTFAGHKVYARRDIQISGKWKTVYLHRFIAGAPDYLEVDHIDGDPLNNRRSNLRLATKSENAQNRGASSLNKSGFKGVCWDSLNKKWRAQIETKGKNKYLGNFSTVEDAYAAYCAANAEMHGDFGRVS